MLIDTHTHFYDDWLLPDAEAVVQRALDAGVGKMIQADIDSQERPRMWEIGLRHPGVLFQMAGVYPGSITADNWQYELDQVHSLFCTTSDNQTWSEATQGVWGIRPPVSETFLKPMAIVAIGEIGLDYHEGREFEKEQKEALRVQMELASAKNLPVNIHLRDAWEDFLQILKDTKHLNLRGNLHCFSGSYEVYQEANRYGDWAVGIGGVITFKNSKLAGTVERIPLHHILLETDAPYLAPGKHRGERNESAFLPIVAEKVAEVKGLSFEECAAITTHNAEQLFNI
ncbi:MAG: TatD family hydrolase [Bacteroidales bacterium]|nr:TatD family hydrolase [Bacteroidales bacterium]